MNKDFIKGVSIGCALAVVVGGTLVFAEPVKQNIEAVYNDIKIVIHGEQITPKDGDGNIVNPFIYDGTTYLPIRAVSEALGETVDWDGSTNTVYIGTERPIATPTPTGQLANNTSSEPQTLKEYLEAHCRVRSDKYHSLDPITWEEQNNRQPTILRYDDPNRLTAIEGDIFIAPDGNSYELHRGKAFILGEDLIMQGVKLAIDLGRVDPFDSSEVVKNNYQANTYAFGWVDSIVRTAGRRYIVRNGVGLWDTQWQYITNNYYPSEDGTELGQIDQTGFFQWSPMMEMWVLINADR